jgi:pilus assembly protein CpaB
MTTTVVQNVEVLSTGERLQPDPSGKPEHVNVVTLLMTPDDAQKLALAGVQGTMQFVLRNGEDKEQAERNPVLMRELQRVAKSSASATSPARVTRVVVRPVAAPKPAVYEVEVFDGTKKSIEKF